jgi:hypothetical protein
MAVICVLVILFMPLIVYWGYVSQARREERKKIRRAQQIESERRAREAAVYERFGKDITDPAFLPVSEQEYVNALAARYQDAGYKIVSQNCHSRGPDMIMSRRGHKILVEAKLFPETHSLYSAIGQILRYGVENSEAILATAIFGFIPDWFPRVCEKCNIILINSLQNGIENILVESYRPGAESD